MSLSKRTGCSLLALSIVGCASNTPPTQPSQPVNAVTQSEGQSPLAVVRGETVTREEVVHPLLQQYGLNFLLLTVQFKIARQEANKAGITITPADVENERNLTIKNLFPEADQKDYAQLIDQLLAKQGISRQQFELLISTNAILRKIAEPSAVNSISEDNIKRAFELKYGAKFVIRDIKLPNLAAVQRARNRLAAGQAFEAVARQMSADAETAPQGGMWQPFGASSQDINQVIKEHALALKVGEVSETISTDGVYHIIRLEKIEPPNKVVKLEGEIHDRIKKELTERLIQQKIKLLRGEIATEIANSDILAINDPLLKEQFDKQVAEAKRQAEEQKKANMQEMIGRLAPATRPATAPSK